MTRLASRPVCGPAASSSAPTLPALAASPLAPEESAPLPTSVDDDGPGLGFLLPHPAPVNATATIRMISIFRILLTPPLLRKWSPGRFPYLTLLGLQPQPRQAIDRYGGEHGAIAVPFRIHE